MDTTRQRIVGDAILSNRGYELLQDMTTQFQGRLAGTAGNAKSMDYLEAHLQELGIRTHRERFDVPGWRRGTDRVTVTSSMNRPLRAAALGYVAAHAPVAADLVLVENTHFDNLDPIETKGRIALAAPNLRFIHSQYERLAVEFGMVGVLLTNRVDGGQLRGSGGRARHYHRDAAADLAAEGVEDGGGRGGQRRLGSDALDGEGWCRRSGPPALRWVG